MTDSKPTSKHFFHSFLFGFIQSELENADDQSGQRKLLIHFFGTEEVIKQYVKGRVIGITERVVFGVEELVPLVKISTSLLERLNGTIRLHVSPLRRKTRCFAKLKREFETARSLVQEQLQLLFRAFEFE